MKKEATKKLAEEVKKEAVRKYREQRRKVVTTRKWQEIVPSRV